MPSGSHDPALLRRVEEASLNSWPAPHQVLLDGWVLRFAAGYTRRANSATPLDAGTMSLAAKLTACEALYAAQDLPAVVRVRSFDDPALDAALKAHDYRAEGESPVLWGTIGPEHGTDMAEIWPGAAPAEWLDTQARLSGCDVAARRRILDAVAVPHAFAGSRLDGPGSPLGSVAFGAVHAGLLCLHLVATDPAARRRGLSRRTLSALLAWARDAAGAREACLQVAAENAGAIALYRGLGLRTELFRYHYRRQGAA